MTGGGGEASPPAPPSPEVNGGDFLLQLLRNPPHHPPVLQSQPPPQSPLQALPHDPAVAAVGPSVPFPPLFQSPSNGRDYASHLPWTHAPPLFAPHNFYHHQGFLQNPNPSSVPNFGFNQTHQHALPRGFGASGEGFVEPGIIGASSKANPIHELEQNLIFRSVQRDSLINENFNGDLSGKFEPFARNDRESSSGNPWRLNSMEDKLENSNNLGQNQIKFLGGLRGHEKQKNSSSGGDGGGLGWGRQLQGGNFRGPVPPPGFASKPSGGNKEYADRARDFEHNMDKGKNNFVELNHRGFGSNNVHERDGKYLLRNGRNQYVVSGSRGLSRQLDSPGPPPGSNLQSVLASDVEDSMSQLQGEDVQSGEEIGAGVMRDMYGRTSAQGQTELDDLEERLISSLGLEDESDEKSDKKKHQSSRDKDYRSDKRGAFILGQRVRMLKRQVMCRGDINRMNAAFLAIYESLIPTEDEKLKQKQLLALLDKIVCKEWPDARLYVYGSCANSFGFSKSDIDICLAIEDANIDKAEVLLKLADMLKADNLQNVQALTRARVPIVKLMDPETGICCDICVNNVLAVVNTKLLRDYAQIDVRLRQLAFIVKHWAKIRGVNVTYQGTLSSYAYVLMCIHFLQQRRPAILPCLQGMEATYSVTVDNTECAFFDKVEKLCGFGSLNAESLPRLVWAFFNYWAYWHDYANDVVSVRTGTLLSKRAKDWTRRIGNDRHLICIEDPFEVSHDLGRVVDKFSIRVLREEFERAAEIMQCDSNPCVRLFEPYIPS